MITEINKAKTYIYPRVCCYSRHSGQWPSLSIIEDFRSQQQSSDKGSTGILRKKGWWTMDNRKTTDQASPTSEAFLEPGQWRIPTSKAHKPGGRQTIRWRGILMGKARQIEGCWMERQWWTLPWANWARLMIERRLKARRSASGGWRKTTSLVAIYTSWWLAIRPQVSTVITEISIYYAWNLG